MKKNKWVKTMCMALGGMLFLSTAIAMPRGGGHGGKGGPEMNEAPPHVLSELNLSETQLETMKKNKIAKQREMIKIRAAMEEAELDLAEELSATKPSKSKVAKTASKIGKLHEQKIMHRAESLIELKSILTDEQLKKLETQMLLRGGPEGGLGLGMGMKNKGRKKKGRR